ncbi:acyltransferase family protein [Hymenobacter perfusus]|uniref:Acyltransferase n=1 Tax=Hymenobacter perfusus TaxID=1236770 RepID=A0A3R9MN46_9BACT|nr:acyltransferase [Hymenobacter perfusus]RSK44371.1 acyltransferase [Hymenobacter perfusus]
MNAISKPYYPALTGIRAIAAYMVFFYHFNPLSLDTWAGRLVERGGFGVVIFFVLSGFLIASRYMNHLQLSLAWGVKYLWGRVARIYPMYFLITAVTFLAMSLDVSYDHSGQWQSYGLWDKALVATLNFTFLRGFFKQFLLSGVSQGWTLTIEETFYFLAPFILLVARRRYWPLLGAGILFLAVGGLLVKVLAPLDFYGLMGSYSFFFENTFFGRCGDFLFGIALAYCISKGKELKLAQGYHTIIGLVLTVACIATMAWLHPPVGQSAPLESGLILGLSIAINYAMPASIALWLYGLVRETTISSRFLSSNFMQTLGKSSYVFYLIHVGVLEYLLSKFTGDNLFVKFIALNLLAYILFRIVEEPMHKFLMRKMPKSPVLQTKEELQLA